MDSGEHEGIGPEETGTGGAQADIDTGEPIAQLRDLALTTPPGFLSRVRGSIDRRVLWSDITVFSWSALARTTLEYLAMFFQFLQPRDSGDARGDGDGSDPD